MNTTTKPKPILWNMKTTNLAEFLNQ